MINILNSYTVKQVLSLTQTGCHDNVTIVCSNATVLSWPQYFQCSEISWIPLLSLMTELSLSFLTWL